MCYQQICLICTSRSIKTSTIYDFSIFCKKRCSSKFPKTHRKTPMLKCLINEVTELRPPAFLKRDSSRGVFPWILQKFLEHLLCITHDHRMLYKISVLKNLAKFTIKFRWTLLVLVIIGLVWLTQIYWCFAEMIVSQYLRFDIIAVHIFLCMFLMVP